MPAICQCSTAAQARPGKPVGAGYDPRTFPHPRHRSNLRRPGSVSRLWGVRIMNPLLAAATFALHTLLTGSQPPPAMPQPLTVTDNSTPVSAAAGPGLGLVLMVC